MVCMESVAIVDLGPVFELKLDNYVVHDDHLWNLNRLAFNLHAYIENVHEFCLSLLFFEGQFGTNIFLLEERKQSKAKKMYINLKTQNKSGESLEQASIHRLMKRENTKLLVHWWNIQANGTFKSDENQTDACKD